MPNWKGTWDKPEVTQSVAVIGRVPDPLRKAFGLDNPNETPSSGKSNELSTPSTSKGQKP
jgi:hypothetical protein